MAPKAHGFWVGYNGVMNGRMSEIMNPYLLRTDEHKQWQDGKAEGKRLGKEHMRIAERVAKSLDKDVVQ